MTDHGVDNGYSQSCFADVLAIFQQPEKDATTLYKELVDLNRIPAKGMEFFEDAIYSLAERHLERMGIMNTDFIYGEDASHRLYILSYLARIINEVRDFNEFGGEE
jgi:hypothetical protein